MKTHNISSLLMQGCKTVGVQFDGTSKFYTYKTMITLEIDDQVVVPSGSGNSAAIAVVKRVDTIPQISVTSNIDFKWIIQKIDTAEYDALNAKEAEFRDELLAIEQKATVSNAMAALQEYLGTDSNLLEAAVSKLNAPVSDA